MQYNMIVMMMRCNILFLLLASCVFVLLLETAVTAAFVAKSPTCTTTPNNRRVVAITTKSTADHPFILSAVSVPSTTTDAAAATDDAQQEQQQDEQLQVQDYYQKQTKSWKPFGNTSPITRAFEIANIMFGNVFKPIVDNLLEEGIPETFELFWSRSNSMYMTNAQSLTQALEELGPTYVKFGQALGSRPDIIPKSLATALSTLHDNMEPFDTNIAKQIILQELITTKAHSNSEGCTDDTIDSGAFQDDLQAITDALDSTTKPIAAASVGQVYKVFLPSYGKHVAIKVQRPGIRDLVTRDATLLRSVATVLESIPALPNQKETNKRAIATELVNAVDEFMSRIFEELDYRNEAQNAITFGDLYSTRNNQVSDDVKVIVPEILEHYCTENVIVMEWIDGTKLTNLKGKSGTVDANDVDADDVQENLAIVRKATQCTLRQLLVDGVLHADPHSGNLLKVKEKDDAMNSNGTATLGYLDFGIISTIPSQVRDGLVCSVALLVFQKDTESVAGLFGELQLLPQYILDDAIERQALNVAMAKITSDGFEWPTDNDSDNTEGTKVPVLKFDKLLDSMSRLVPRFEFQLPPYFINNARALSTLEGIARTLDPSFNVLQEMYPYAINLLLTNPSNSPVVDDTLQKLIRSPVTGRVDSKRVQKLLQDSSLITGYKKRKVLWDILKTKHGQILGFKILGEELNHRLLGGRLGGRGKRDDGNGSAVSIATRKRKKRRFNYLKL